VRDASFREFAAHDLGRTYISALLDQGVDLLVASEPAGQTEGAEPPANPGRFRLPIRSRTRSCRTQARFVRQEVLKVLRAFGGRSRKTLGTSHIHLVDLPQQANEKAVARALSKRKEVKFAEPDFLFPPTEFIPNDEFYSQ